jgi:nucleotide-binding universal stress UspA family protein
MLPFHKILATTDLSELSEAGLRYAFNIAAAAGAEVIVFHAIGYHEAMPVFDGDAYAYALSQFPLFDDLVNEREKQLDEFLRKHHLEAKNVKIRREVVVGIPYEKILVKAAEEKVDAIVMATHGRSGLAHAFLGSVAEKVVRLAQCPVLTIRPAANVEAKAA